VLKKRKHIPIRVFFSLTPKKMATVLYRVVYKGEDVRPDAFSSTEVGFLDSISGHRFWCFDPPRPGLPTLAVDGYGAKLPGPTGAFAFSTVPSWLLVCDFSKPEPEPEPEPELELELEPGTGGLELFQTTVEKCERAGWQVHGGGVRGDTDQNTTDVGLFGDFLGFDKGTLRCLRPCPDRFYKPSMWVSGTCWSRDPQCGLELAVDGDFEKLWTRVGPVHFTPREPSVSCSERLSAMFGDLVPGGGASVDFVVDVLENSVHGSHGMNAVLAEAFLRVQGKVIADNALGANAPAKAFLVTCLKGWCAEGADSDACDKSEVDEDVFHKVARGYDEIRFLEGMRRPFVPGFSGDMQRCKTVSLRTLAGRLGVTVHALAAALDLDGGGTALDPRRLLHMNLTPLLDDTCAACKTRLPASELVWSKSCCGDETGYSHIEFGPEDDMFEKSLPFCMDCVRKRNMLV
jgi:hypothetical protein